MVHLRDADHIDARGKLVQADLFGAVRFQLGDVMLLRVNAVGVHGRVFEGEDVEGFGRGAFIILDSIPIMIKLLPLSPHRFEIFLNHLLLLAHLIWWSEVKGRFIWQHNLSFRNMHAPHALSHRLQLIEGLVFGIMDDISCLVKRFLKRF